MAGEIQLYIDILSNNAGSLSAISALQSLDATVKKNDASIKGLEKSYTDAVAEANKLPKGGVGLANSVKAIKEAEDKLTNARQKQQLALAKQDLYRKGLDKQVEGVRAAQAAEASRAANSSRLLSAIESIKGGLGSIAEQAQSAGGPIGNLAGKIQSLAKGGTVGIILAAVAALAALAVAGIAAAAAMTVYAFKAADAARSSRLLSEAALGSAAAGDELETVVSQMSNLAPGLSAKLKEVGRDLAEVRIQGRDAQRVLNTFGIVATARGEQAAGAIKGIAETSRMANRLILGARDRFGEFASLKGTGVKAADVYAALAKSMKTSIPEAQRAVIAGLVPFKKGLEALELAAETKLGGVVARQMMSLSTQAEKLKENVSKLFSGVNIEKFLEGLKTVTDLFDSNTVTGYVLREVFTAVFSKIASLAALVFPYIVAGIKGIVAGFLITVTIAKDLYKQFQQTFGGVGDNIDGIALAFKAGVFIVGLFVGSIVALTGAIAFLGIVALTALAPIWIPIAIWVALLYVAVRAAMALGAAMTSAFESIKNIDLSKAAANIMNTLINGIKAKIADVKSVIASVGDAITGAFDSKMEIHSPSKVMERRANYVVDPLVDVPKERTGDVQQAIGGLGNLDSPRAASNGNGRGGFSPEKIEFHFHGLREEDVAPKVREVLTEIWLGGARGWVPVTQ